MPRKKLSEEERAQREIAKMLGNTSPRFDPDENRGTITRGQYVADARMFIEGRVQPRRLLSNGASGASLLG